MDPNLDNETQGEITGDEELRTLNAPPLQTREHPVVLPGTYNVIRGLNRNTTWLATGLLCSVVFGALVLAVQEWHPKAADQGGEERPTRGDLLMNANPGTLSKIVSLSAESSKSEITSGQATSVDHVFTAISPQENPPPPTETPESTQTPVVAPTPEINQPDAQATASPWSSVQWQDFARAIRPKIHNIRHKSSARVRFVDVKKRLNALWHQSLRRSQTSGAYQLGASH